MRILMAADVLPDPDSGAAGTEYRTLEALRALGHEATAVWAGDLGRRIQHGNLHYLCELPRQYRRIHAEQAGKWDVYHFNQGSCYLAAGMHARRGQDSVFVYRSHGFEPLAHERLAAAQMRDSAGALGILRNLLRGIMRRLLFRQHRLAIRYADGVIVSSSSDRDYILSHYEVPPARVARIPQAAPERYRSVPALPVTRERMKRILCVGEPAVWKGADLSLAAASQLLEEDKAATFRWVCRGEHHQRVLAAFKGNLADRVSVGGWQSQETLMDEYDRAGILLFPSRFEGFGKVFLEAMARGMVVVGNRIGGMGDAITDGRDGYLLPELSSEAIVGIVRGIWRDAASAEKISAAAARTAAKYSWERVARETASAYSAWREMKRR